MAVSATVRIYIVAVVVWEALVVALLVSNPGSSGTDVLIA
jgi:hypothetical protein